MPAIQVDYHFQDLSIFRSYVHVSFARSFYAWFFVVGMILNAESVTVLVTVTSLGVEVDKPRKLVNPRFIESSDIGADPSISPVGSVLPRCSVPKVARPVVSFASVFMIDVNVSVGLVALLAIENELV